MAKRKKAGKRRPPASSAPDRPTKEKADAVRELPPGELFPPAHLVLARGLGAVVCSPATIVFPLLVVPLIWLGLLAFGFQIFPAEPYQVLAIPPVSSAFDFGVAASMFGLNGAVTLLFLLGITFVRSVVWAVLVGMLDEALEYGSVSMLGVLRGLNAFWGVFLYCCLSIGVMLFGYVLVPGFLGPALGGTASLVVLVGGLYLLTFAPAVSVRFGLPGYEAVARAARGARMPGSVRLLLLAATYFLFSMVLLRVGYPGAGEVTANPTVADWAFVLLATLVHAVFLAAFIQTWRHIEDFVPKRSKLQGKASGRRGR